MKHTVPPQLRPFLFKKGKKSARKKRSKRSHLVITADNVIRKTKRRTQRNPPSRWVPHGMHIIEIWRGKGERLRWTGIKFSSTQRPKLFPSVQEAKRVGQHLLAKWRDLDHYQMGVRS